MARNAVLKCAELEKPALCAATVSAGRDGGDGRTHSVPDSEAAQRQAGAFLEQVLQARGRQAHLSGQRSGAVIRLDELARQTWHADKLASERFYDDPGQMRP
jgi:hypothetical protein